MFANLLPFHTLPQVETGKPSSGQRARIEVLIKQYPDVLSVKLGLKHLMEYEIQLIDKIPVRLPPYRQSTPKMEYLSGDIKTLLREGVIKPSLSKYSSQMFLVPKPGGAYRAVVDFRVLNKRISIESVPFPMFIRRSIALRMPRILSPRI